MFYQGWSKSQLILILLSTLAAGCGQERSVTRWGQHPIPIYADQSIVSSEAVNKDFQDAMAFWEAKAGQKLFDYKGEWDTSKAVPFAGAPGQVSAIFANVIFFQSPWPFPQNVIGQTTVMSEEMDIKNAMIMINPDAFFCTGDCASQPFGNSQRKNFAHELGHFLGLGHSPDDANVMYPVLQPGGELSTVAVDQTALIQVTAPIEE